MEKYIADMHIHSEYSFDSKMPIKNIVAKENEKGCKVIAITDHIELRQENIINIVNRLVKRDKEIDQIQKNAPVIIIKGIEVSEPHLYQDSVKFLNELDIVEYIIGSIHHLHGNPLRFYKDDVDDYLRSILDMVLNANIDTVAHLDYIKRYGTNNKFDEKLLEEILNVIIDRNLTLEINTSGYKRCGSLFPDIEIINKYAELGGTKVVFGSDAHIEEDLYEGIDKARNQTKKLNLTPGIIKNGQFKSI